MKPDRYVTIEREWLVRLLEGMRELVLVTEGLALDTDGLPEENASLIRFTSLRIRTTIDAALSDL